jgi:hypothetical protein
MFDGASSDITERQVLQEDPVTGAVISVKTGASKN